MLRCIPGTICVKMMNRHEAGYTDNQAFALAFAVFSILHSWSVLDLTVLKRLWMVSVLVSRADVELLREAHPDLTTVNTGCGSTNLGWRTYARDFAMIDMSYERNYINEEFSKYDGMG